MVQLKFLLTLLLLDVGYGSYVVPNPLNGTHLRVLAGEFPGSLTATKNASGHVIEIDGILKHQIDALSTLLNFSYTLLPFSIMTAEDSPFAKGLLYYLSTNASHSIDFMTLSKSADYALSSIIGTPSRFAKVDLAASWLQVSFGILLPYPKESTNISAATKPLSLKVWILSVVAIFAVLVSFRFFTRYTIERKAKGRIRGVSKSGRNIQYFHFVFGNLLSQGQPIHSDRLTIRLVAGAWCCFCFFLAQAYCTTLMVHLMSPNQKLLVNSVYDTASTPGVSLTIDRGLAMDVMLQDVTSGRWKPIADMVKNDPSLRCNQTSKCLEQVKRGGRVYCSTVSALKTMMADDFNKNNFCHYTLLKETFWTRPIFTSLPKNSRFTEHISRGILQLKSAGLINLWETWYIPTVRKCTEINNNRKKTRLSLNHLSGAFLILAIGSVCSFIVFLAEKLFSFFRN